MHGLHTSNPSVYVLVPPAPSTLKENNPIMYSTIFTSSTLKRKHEYPVVPNYQPHYQAHYPPHYQPHYHPHYYQPQYQQYQIPPTVVKKPKLESGSSTPAAPDVTPAANSHVYCHQCGQKRDREDSAQCTYVDVQVISKDKPPKTRRCHNKFCKPCLKNRYNEDIDVIKSNIAPTANQPGHIGEQYEYKCPKCRDICNCSRCRKAKGLEPTGKFGHATNATDKKGKKNASKLPVEGSSKSDDTKAKRAPRQKAKLSDPLPALKWTKLHTGLSVDDAEARFHIREFVLRFFGKTMLKAHLEELDQIGGNGRSRYDEDEIVPWISEACLKSLILAFLGVLVEEETNAGIKKAIQMGMKEMRSAGLGLSKIWLILSSLRDALDASEPDSEDSDSEDSDTVPSFPDPMPLPDSAIHSTRRTRSASTLVVDTVQMIPVILGLIDAVVEASVIRAELEDGARDSKEVAKDVKDAMRNVNDRWEKLKKETDDAREQEYKAKRDVHKQLLKDIEGASKVAMHRFNPRFSPLGTDKEGRVYYALSPSISDTDSALEFITSMAAETEDSAGKQNLKPKRKRRSKREEDRSALKDWSWFIAVYGTKPPPQLGTLPFKPVVSRSGSAEDSDESDDETEDKWWAIRQPAEMRKLIVWITAKYRLNESADSSSSPVPSNATDSSSGSASPPERWDERGIEMSPHPSTLELRALVSNLEDYVVGLEFRLRDGDGAIVGISDLDGKGKNKAA